MLFRCHHFVTFCYSKGLRLYDVDCCQRLFDQKMAFTSFGVCYSINREIIESYAFQFSAVKLWLTPRQSYLEYPGMRSVYLTTNVSHHFDALSEQLMKFKGSKSVYEAGLFYAISSKDEHPAAVVEKQVYMAHAGTVEHLSFHINQVYLYITSSPADKISGRF